MKKLLYPIALLLCLSLLWGCAAGPAPGTVPPVTDPPAVPSTDTPSPSGQESIPPESSEATEPEQPPASVVRYGDIKALWLSQFDLTGVYLDGSRQRSEADFTARMGGILDNVRAMGFNTVFLQIRPNADSMYPSEFYPMSAYVVGTLGQEADYDPVGVIVELAHARQLSIHAWINPMRGMAEEEITRLDEALPMAQWYRDESLRGRYLVSVDGRWYLNPAYGPVRELIQNGAKEALERYDFDGLHMDDYFYPTTDAAFDREAFEAFGGGQSLAEFRREQLSLLVAGLYRITHEVRPGLIFGISPAGNVDTVYNSQYADVYRWCSEAGYLDYICPQVYFGLEHSRFDFRSVCRTYQDMITLDSVELIVGMTFGKALSREDQWAGGGKYEWRDNRDVLQRCLADTRALARCRGVAVFCYQYLYDPLTGETVAGTAEERANFLPLLQSITWGGEAPENTPAGVLVPMDPAPEGLYLVKVTDPDHPIHKEPGFTAPAAGTVAQAGTYTIMEEVRDDDGTLWGRLKSGAGWIPVAGLEKQYLPHVLLTADYADENLLLHGSYLRCEADRTEQAVVIALYPQKGLSDAQVFSTAVEDEGFLLQEVLGSFPALTPDKPLLLWVSFPGDMTAYCLRFADEAGAVHHVLISISGRDGSVLLSEYALGA